MTAYLLKGVIFSNFRQVKILLGLIKNTKCKDKLTRYVLLLYTCCYKLMQQKILKQYTPKSLIILTSNNCKRSHSDVTKNSLKRSHNDGTKRFDNDGTKKQVKKVPQWWYQEQFKKVPQWWHQKQFKKVPQWWHQKVPQ